MKMDTSNGQDFEKCSPVSATSANDSDKPNKADQPVTAVCTEQNGSEKVVDVKTKEEPIANTVDVNDVTKESVVRDDTPTDKVEIKIEPVSDDQSQNAYKENVENKELNSDNKEDTKQSNVKEVRDLKRKRKSLSNQDKTASAEDSLAKNKRKRLNITNDKFCWRCHKESVEAHCSACPRSWHRKCMGGLPPTSLDNWICGECAAILKAENAETRSAAMAQLSIDQLCMLLKHVVERMRDYPGSEPFWKAVDLSEVPNYLDYVIKPMDLTLLESNVHAKLYGSTDAFMADAKWIQHNCIVFNTCGGVYADTSKLTNAAKQIIKTARQEVSEIEACPDCFAHGRNLPRPLPSWFIEPCHRPHPLVWAKLKGFPFWPAKAMPRINAQGHVDVRFFGAHDRAWVPPKDLFLYSQDPPAPLPRKRKLDMDDCIKEITRHCRKLELAFGQFKFAPPKVQYDPNDPMQIKLMLPNYDPHQPNNIIPTPVVTPRRKTLGRKSITPAKDKPKSVSPVASVTVEPESGEPETGDDKMTSKVQNAEKSLAPEAKSTTETDTDLNTSIQSKEPEKAELKAETPVQNKKNTTIEESKDTSLTNNINVVQNSTDVSSAKVNDTKDVSPKIKPVEKFVKHKTPKIELKLAQFPKKGFSVKTSPKNNSLQSSLNSPKTITKPTKNVTKVYKPKARMVDKLNAERALKSVMENAANTNKQHPGNSPNSKNHSKISEGLVQSTASNLTGKSPNRTDNTANKSTSFLFVVNNGATDIVKNSPLIEGIREDTDNSVAAVKQELTPSKKESKAKKSFHNKPPDYPQISKTPNDATSISPDALPLFPNKNESSDAYQLIPPEAGPLSSQLYKGAQDLVRRMAQLMEEAYKEAAEESRQNEEEKDTCQASVHFLRLQIERMRWQHQQQMAELKHNTDRLMREMRASLEAEKIRAIEETRREAEEDKKRCIEETKSKQWCAMCGQEAMFYCCWNTAYCDYPCQKSHWATHMRTCAQQPSFTTIVTSSAGNSNQQQVMPRLVINTQHATSNIWRA